MKYKLIVMDMDGTLTNSEKIITPRTCAALIAAQKQGARLVLASGRPTYGLYKEAKQLEMEKYGGLLLSFNGANVQDYVTKEVLYNQTIPMKCIVPVFNNARALNLNIMVHKDEHIIVEDAHCYKADYEARLTAMKLKPVNSLNEFIDFAPNKILLSAPQEHLKNMLEDFKMPFGDMLSMCCSAPFYLEVMAQGIDKGKALDGIAKRLHIDPSEIIAFGDEMNDLTMLQYAGHGVAMGNAVKPIKLIAKEITLSNDEDGIAVTLEPLLTVK